MKALMIALLCTAALALAGTAHAYAIYNHTGHRVCIYTGDGADGCDFTVHGHGHHNGEHGSGLNHIHVLWHHHGHCYGSGSFDIPKGGFIRIDEHEVKIFNHHEKHLRSKGIHRTDCPPNALFWLM